MRTTMTIEKQTMQCHYVIALFLMTGLVVSSFAESQFAEPHDSWTQDLLMKGAKPSQPEAYICAAYPVNEKEAYIYKFEALASATTAHHILMYGCNGEPFSDEPMWRCPPMCKGSESTIIFAWAKNAPPTELPEGVGLRVGQNSHIKTIVLQVHYARAFQADEKPDNSGIRVYMTHEKQPFVSGIYFLGSGAFSIPPGKSSYPVDVCCAASLKESIFPFAYRTHAHGLGKVITGYQFNGTYHEIGKGNPQWPQAFYPVKEKIEVKPGDFLAARCTYNSTSVTHTVSVGSTGNDEMCNFYIMFYTKSSVEDPSGSCNWNEHPELTGANFPADVSEPLPPNPELEAEAKGHHHHVGSDTETQAVVHANNKTLDILMPGTVANEPESHKCIFYQVEELESYIYKFEALANISVVHHISLYGFNGSSSLIGHNGFSGRSSSKGLAWNCSELIEHEGVVQMYAWTKDAPPVIFPAGIGVRIGQHTSITTIILQVHYGRTFTANDPPDHSGVRIYTTQERQPFVVGMYNILSEYDIFIPSGEPSYAVDISCRYNMTTPIFLLFYLPHTHGLGTMVTGYHYNGSYHEIGKMSPLLPQAFYPVENKIQVKQGDYITIRCTFDTTTVRNPGRYDTCSLLMMYYTDNSKEDFFVPCVKNFISLPPNPATVEEAGYHHIGGVSGGGHGVIHQAIHFEHKLEFNSSWPSEKIKFGQIGGIATDVDGNVYIFHRGSRQWTARSFLVDNAFIYPDSPIEEDVIVVLDSQGRLLQKFGARQYFMPHGIEVDKDGNIWLTDVALHQVFKISRGETKPSLVLGEKFKPGTDQSHFCKPTDVAVLSTGEFYVSDGYCNGRVLKFSKNGTLIKAWGERKYISTSLHSTETFDIPHSITVSEENDLVCVADRENGRVQCFDLDGNFRHTIKHPEFGTRLFAVEHCPHHGGVLYAVNGPSYAGSVDTIVQGFTLDIKTGDLLETWNVPQHLQNPHDVCVHTASQSVYVGELNPQVVWKSARVSLEDHKKTIQTKNDDFTPVVIVGCVLAGTVILLLVIILFVKANNAGKLSCCDKTSVRGILGNSHKGFDPLKTEESDHDSDHSEYIAPKKVKSKPKSKA